MLRLHITQYLQVHVDAPVQTYSYVCGLCNAYSRVMKSLTGGRGAEVMERPMKSLVCLHMILTNPVGKLLETPCQAVGSQACIRVSG